MGEQLFKVLGPGRVSIGGGTGKWVPGRWRAVRGPLVACKHGLHLCRTQDLVRWLGPEIWRAEAEGDRIDETDKIVVRRARITTRVEWNERTARLFAAACAEDVLNLISEPQRAVCAETIEVARRFANGEATDAERSAARSAATSAAESAQTKRLFEMLGLAE